MTPLSLAAFERSVLDRAALYGSTPEERIGWLVRQLALREYTDAIKRDCEYASFKDSVNKSKTFELDGEGMLARRQASRCVLENVHE